MRETPEQSANGPRGATTQVRPVISVDWCTLGAVQLSGPEPIKHCDSRLVLVLDLAEARGRLQNALCGCVGRGYRAFAGLAVG